MTENPRVGSSILSLGTSKDRNLLLLQRVYIFSALLIRSVPSVTQTGYTNSDGIECHENNLEFPILFGS